MIYNGKWVNLDDNDADKVCKFEGQVWFGLRELLLNPKCAPYYDITEVRISQLTKVEFIFGFRYLFVSNRKRLKN